ncbi:MAG: LPS export ABC transporter permease LptG [Alphaproteobacteria bacterium]|jgi:lipopolysaccharide export system permease protein
MALFARYLNRLFVARFALMLAGLVALASLLDMMAHADEVVAGDGALALWRYFALRLPVIVSKLLPFSVLIAALLTLVSLVRHGEIVVMLGAGVSPWRLVLAFLPAVGLLGAAHFWLDDAAVPPAAAELRAWAAADYGAAAESGAMAESDRRTWLREGNDVIRLGTLDTGDSARLTDVTIFQRDVAGILTVRIDAATVVLEAGAWVLYDVTRYDVAANAVETIARLPWAGRLRPDLLSTLMAHPRELSLGDVWRYLGAPEFGSRPLYVYETWFNRKIVVPLASLLMVLIAVPLSQRFQRHGGAATTLTLGIAIGFCFFVFDGFALAVGEAGLVPPVLAAWAPSLAFAAAGAALGFYGERR